MIDIEIDKLTNSIENTRTGEVFDTLVTPIKFTEKSRKKIGNLIGIKK